MIPLISSLNYGPLGVCQLPRTWWKISLRHAGLMDEEYPDFSGGLDRMVFEVLGLDKDTTFAYLHENMPTYLDFEAYVVAQKGDTFFKFEQQDAIIRWNASLRARKHTRPEKIEETYTDISSFINAISIPTLRPNSEGISSRSSQPSTTGHWVCANCPERGIKSCSKPKACSTPTIPI
jgi:hypothetical protein